MCDLCVPAFVLDFLELGWNPVLVHDAENLAHFYLIRQPLNISLAPCQLFFFFFFFWSCFKFLNIFLLGHLIHSLHDMSV